MRPFLTTLVLSHFLHSIGYLQKVQRFHAVSNHVTTTRPPGKLCVGAIASADVRALQAPFPSGITPEDYQLDPVVRAIQLVRVNLLIADDAGLGTQKPLRNCATMAAGRADAPSAVGPGVSAESARAGAAHGPRSYTSGGHVPFGWMDCLKCDLYYRATRGR